MVALNFTWLAFTDIFKRFCRVDKRSKLPKWIQEHLSDAQINLSIEEAIMAARKWFPLMAQPFTKSDQMGE